MAESRRVLLTTLSRDVFNFTSKPDTVRKCSSGALREKDARSDRPADTVRLELTLFEPDEQSFPELNYLQLIENKMNQADDVPLTKSEQEESEMDVCAIARRLEEKYGGQHKKRDRIQDLIDIGYGYDEEDSFIDNSEAYDEYVPSSIMTKFGGFYVNSGMLQFRQAFKTEADDFSTEEGTFESIKKRKLICEQDAPKKYIKASGELKSTKDQKLRTVSKMNEMKIKKKKSSVKTLSVTSMLKKFRREKEKERQKMERANEIAADLNATTVLLPADAAGGGGSGLTDPLLSLIGSTNDHTLIQAASTVDFDIDLDSLLDVSEGTMSPKPLPQASTETQLTQTRTGDQTQLNILSDAESHLNPKTTCLLKPHLEQIQLQLEPSLPTPECTAMPEGLPPRLEESIRSLMMAAKTSEWESKFKFFSPYINSILLDIELQCQELSGQLRSKVYRHLSSFLPCSKDTLVKRVRKLLLTHEKEPLSVEDSLQKLKEAIERSMPEQIACFHENCQAYEQLKTSKSTEEENVEERGGRRGPKKLFKWNQEIRECLGDVLKEKMEKFKNDQGIEEYLKTLLHSEVKPLWPKGWVQYRTLMRESRKLLGLFTSLRVNKAKPLKRQFSIGGACKFSNGCTNFHGTSAPSDVPQETDHILIEGSNVSSCVDQDGSLDILAEQALARECPTTLTQKVLAAAMGKHWSLSDDQSRPPPQSSPVDFPGSNIFQVMPPLLQVRDVRRVDAGQVQSSPDAHIIIM